MNAKFPVFFLIFLLLLPQCFGFWWLFEKPKPPLVIVRNKDLNGEDVNFNKLWAEEAWITRLFSTDVNVVDFNVTGDVNATGSLSVDGDAFVGGNFVCLGDANFVDIGFSGFIFGDGSKLTGISAGGSGSGTTYTGTHPVVVNNDTNNVSLADDFNSMYVSAFDSNTNLDGGFANSVYLAVQSVDGGGA